jgi:amino acid adenylation domain-containing protein
MTDRAPLEDFSARLASLPADKRALFEREIKQQIEPSTGISRQARIGPRALSFAQQRLWFLNQLDPGSPAYNLSTALRLPGFLDVNVLKRSLNEIIRRHESLRTSIKLIDGQPFQIIAPALTLDVEIVELTAVSAAMQEPEARRLAFNEAQRGFDLEQGPLIRASLLRLSNADHVLVLTMHHVVSDGWSLGLLFSELTTLYQAYASGHSSPLPELPCQYADYSDWQREYLHGETFAHLLGYWKQQLEGAPPVMELPTDRPRGRLLSRAGATQSFRLTPEVSEGLQALARRQGVTLFILLLAALKTLLHRYTGATDIVIGVPIANRNRTEIENLIGFFVNSLVLRTDLSSNPTFNELLGRVREITLEAYAHQDLPFEKLVEELQPERSLNHNPLFSVAFVLQNVPTLSGAMFDQQPPEAPVTVGAAKFDLSLALAETEREISGSFEYLTALFNGDTISRMIVHFQTLLASIVANPEARLSQLALMSEGERRQLLAGAHGKALRETVEVSVHELFEKHAQQSPENIAVVFGDTKLTYAQLNRRANEFARRLQSLGVGPETKVGLLVERNPQWLVGLLGILKAGGAFVPFDPAYPAERIAYMLRDAGVKVVATQTEVTDKLNTDAAKIVYLDQIEEGSDENTRSNITRHSLAYVIYTSGSTGAPKGVLIEHGALSNMARAQTRLFCMLPEDRVLLFGSLSFDASTFEIVMTLTNGATLYLASREALLPGPSLNRLLNDWAITTITLPPSALAVMPVEQLPALRRIIAAGEACPAELVTRWSRGRRFFNAYGPTETSIWATLWEGDDASTTPPIGRPIDNTSAYLLDAFLQPVPLGGRGEIFIGGAGVGRAYLNLPELTAERFIPDPFSDRPGTRLYRTGDLGRQRRDGQIEFLGRIDHQVKLRGFRIELGEIELALQEHPEVRTVAVTMVEDGAAGKRLIAYLESSNIDEALAAKLRSFLKTKLPDYMIPSSFVVMDQLPLTASGKIDRRALPAPEDAPRGTDKTLVAPEGAVEEVLAGIWAELLGLDQIGRHDGFFGLGGHSLLATQVVSRVLDLLSVELQVRQIFQTQTIAELARAILDNSAQPERIERIANLVLRLSQLTDDEAVSLLDERTVA